MRSREKKKAESTTLVVSDAVTAELVESPDMQANMAINRLPNGQYPKGVSGNPAGRPKGIRYVSESLKLKLAAIGEDGRSGADEIADAIFEAAKAGDMKAAALVMSKSEGESGAFSQLDYLNDYRVEFKKTEQRFLTQEAQIFSIMADEMVDRARAVEIIAERFAEKEREWKKEVRAAQRHFRATEKAFEAADFAIDEGKSVDFDELGEYLDTDLWDRLEDGEEIVGEYEAKLDLMKKVAGKRKQ